MIEQPLSIEDQVEKDRWERWFPKIMVIWFEDKAQGRKPVSLMSLAREFKAFNRVDYIRLTEAYRFKLRRRPDTTAYAKLLG